MLDLLAVGLLLLVLLPLWAFAVGGADLREFKRDQCSAERGARLAQMQVGLTSRDVTARSSDRPSRAA